MPRTVASIALPSPKPLPKGTRQRPWGAGGGCMQTCIQGRCIVIRKRHVNGIAYMSSVNDLLDKVREAGNFPSDNALAQRLGLTRAVVSTWRSGRNPIPDERIAQLCALGKLDGPLWIALIHAERAQSATERALWRLMLDRMSAAAAVVALVALSMPGLANAKTAQIQAVSAADNGGMYIMLPRGLPIRTPISPVLAARCSPSSNPPNARRTWLHGANFSPSMQARRCRLDAPLKDGFGDAPG